MNRRTLLKRMLVLSAAPLLLAACAPANQPAKQPAEVVAPPADEAVPAIQPLSKPLSEWQTLLEPDVYAVLFEEATEPPFSSPLNNEKHEGTFICAACYLPLFSSLTKYDSGTGWPSFYQSLPGAVATKEDNSLGMTRTEYHCIRCSGHQGHLFDDGPPPTGMRYCNNGLALNFVAQGQTLPALRS